MRPGRIRDALCWLGVPVMLVGAYLYASWLDRDIQPLDQRASVNQTR